jgi:hypothetical protein
MLFITAWIDSTAAPTLQARREPRLLVVTWFRDGDNEPGGNVDPHYPPSSRATQLKSQLKSHHIRSVNLNKSEGQVEVDDLRASV